MLFFPFTIFNFGKPFTLGLGQTMVDGRQGRRRDQGPLPGQLQCPARYAPCALEAQVRRSKRHREPSFRQFIITQLGSVSNQYLRFFAVFQLQGQFFYRDGPVRAQPLQYTAAGLKAGIVTLITPGIASRWASGHAMASSVETPAQGLFPGQASPLAAATPIRSPVKDPGPAATATTSISSSVSPQFSRRSRHMGISVRLCVRPLCWKDWAKSVSSSHTATEAAVAEDSRAKIFISLPPRSS